MGQSQVIVVEVVDELKFPDSNRRLKLPDSNRMHMQTACLPLQLELLDKWMLTLVHLCQTQEKWDACLLQI